MVECLVHSISASCLICYLGLNCRLHFMSLKVITYLCDHDLHPIRNKHKKRIIVYIKKYTNNTLLWNSCEWTMHTTLKLECTADSGGYTMKWRRVKPKPCEVRRRWIVLGPGQEKGSSSSWKSTPEESSWSTTSYTERNTWNHEEADLDFCKIKNKKIKWKMLHSKWSHIR